MARKVFFSFHHNPQNVWKVQQIKQSNTTLDSNQFNSNDWEQLKKNGDIAIKRWINSQLLGCSVTCVFITSKTHERPWIQYEINKSIEEKKGIFGIYIHDLKDNEGNSHIEGKNPLPKEYAVYNPSDLITKYDDTPYKVIVSNISKWIEEAATKAGR